MTLLLQAAQMRAIDRAAIEGLGLPGLVLMENAGRGVAEIILRERSDLRTGLLVTIVAGGGQNGGDGFVIARHLAAAGAQVKVILVVARHQIAGDALVFLHVAERTAGVVTVDRSSSDNAESWDGELAGSAVHRN